MDQLRILTDLQGFFTRGQARELGFDDRAVSGAMRAGLWHRIRRGYYTFADIWATADAVERHRIRSRAVLHSLGPAVALSHVSGVIAAGVAVWDVDLSRVHVTRLDGGAGRIEGDVVHHEGFCLDEDVQDTPDGRVLMPTRCVLEAGSLVRGGERALVMVDSLLSRGEADADQLMGQFGVMERWPRMRSMHIPVRMGSADAKSVGETRGRWMFRVHRVPAPVLQYEVRDAGGVLIGITDWAWPEHGLLGEFDGRIKYGRLLRPGQQPGDVVFAEKQREDQLREVTDFRMIRLIWSDYDRPLITVRRVEAKLRRAS